MGEMRHPTPSRRDRARDLRRGATDPEKRLWWHLRHRLPLDGTYFRRQIPLGPYFAAFCCLALKLVVELDSDQHGHLQGLTYDKARTAFLESQGFTILRFWNHRVFREMDGMLDTIAAALIPRTSGSSSG